MDSIEIVRHFAVYVDMCNQNCNTLAFQFGTTGVFTSIPTRAFSIKVQRVGMPKY